MTLSLGIRVKYNVMPKRQAESDRETAQILHSMYWKEWNGKPIFIIILSRTPYTKSSPVGKQLPLPEYGFTTVVYGNTSILYGRYFTLSAMIAVVGRFFQVVFCPIFSPTLTLPQQKRKRKRNSCLSQ